MPQSDMSRCFICRNDFNRDGNKNPCQNDWQGQCSL